MEEVVKASVARPPREGSVAVPLLTDVNRSG